MSRFGRLTDEPATFLVTGARVLDPRAGTDEIRDLAVADGRVVDPGALPADAPTLDGRGLVAAPGLCDVHTHLREPGAEGAETIETAARAAARGGFTTICAMPNTEPPLSEPYRVAWVESRGADAACRVRVVGAVTRDRDGQALADLATLAGAGVVGFSDDGASVASARLARSALASLASLGLPLVEHAEEPTLAASASMRAGPTAVRLGLAGWPASAEAAI
ncbi:MAG: amidohydrolase family protein, partial [Candidatus Limnocylindria bacterium]